MYLYGEMLLSGRTEKFPYSLSRWTDLPGSRDKWSWFEQQLQQGWMVAFNPKTAMPGKWSLAVDDVYGLIFWTRNARNLVDHADLLKKYPLVVHFTLTGWHEVERGAPGIEDGLAILKDTVQAFGPGNVTWRFSPVPMVPDVLPRFERIASQVVQFGVQEVYVSFLQENDRLPEQRAPRVRGELLKQLAAQAHDLRVLLCNEDRTLDLKGPGNLARGICESGSRFAPSGYLIDCPPVEGCGCALAVDPFTVNESCSMKCAYCYVADRNLAPKKRNTTKRTLPVVG